LRPAGAAVSLWAAGRVWRAFALPAESTQPIAWRAVYVNFDELISILLCAAVAFTDDEHL
jgi:hypothetical protein